MQLRKQFRFEAAHVLPHHPGKCGRLHGHSYRFDVVVEGPLQADGPGTGMVIDFDALAAIVKPAVVEKLDHASLNDVMPNPTAEHIALWRRGVGRDAGGLRATGRLQFELPFLRYRLQR